MITIELLQVMFAVEREQDEVRFADLFEEHMARHEADKRRDRDVVVSDADRTIGEGSFW